jgi:RimJ/RimL family protein N-acetyltransferase
VLEIGLGLHEDFRGRGYGFETVAGMLTLAALQRGVTTLRYTVSTGNVASVKLIEKFGFDRIGEQIDDDDGPEGIYEMSFEEFRPRRGCDADARHFR